MDRSRSRFGGHRSALALTLRLNGEFEAQANPRRTSAVDRLQLSEPLDGRCERIELTTCSRRTVSRVAKAGTHTVRSAAEQKAVNCSAELHTGRCTG